MKNVIAKILKARVQHYWDNGQTIASVTWKDSRGVTGTTHGNPDNAHMLALLARAEREGVTITRE